MDDVDDRIDGVDRITMENDTIYLILKNKEMEFHANVNTNSISSIRWFLIPAILICDYNHV